MSAETYPCRTCRRVTARHQCETGDPGCMHCDHCGSGDGPGATLQKDDDAAAYFGEAGFSVTCTGGGCLAYLRVEDDGTHTLVTHDEDAVLPQRLSDPVMVGSYPGCDYGSPIDDPVSHDSAALYLAGQVSA